MNDRLRSQRCFEDYATTCSMNTDFVESHLHDRKLHAYFGIVNWMPIPVDVQWSKLINTAILMLHIVWRCI